jgi:hypothetical protein
LKTWLSGFFPEEDVEMKRIWVVLILLAIVLSACSPAATPGARDLSSRSSNESGAPAVAPAQPPSAAGNLASLTSAQAPDVQRIVIKNASVSLAVNDPAKSMANISKLAEDMGGFVVSANLSQQPLDSGQEVPQASITIRVPAGRLDEALNTIKAETTRPVISENIQSQDVTKDYTDQQSQLRNLQTAEAQLKEIMASATKTEDVLSVYNQLTQVENQIEIVKGQIQYYEQSAALSSISVDLKANEAVRTLSIGGWQPGGVAKDALQALINTLKTLAAIGIWLVIYVVPVLVVIFLPVYALFLIVRRLRRRGKAKTELAPPATPANPT